MKHIYRNDVYIKDGMLVADNTGFGPLPELHYDRVLKRGLDILLCVIALPLVLPLLAILSILIRRDGGPAFFGHVRIGRDGKPFRCWKLRSMVTDSNTRLEHLLATDPKAAAQWKEERKLDNDPRITRLGNVLRKTSLDELPQIYNILRGEMSFVGPRRCRMMSSKKTMVSTSTFIVGCARV